MARQRCPGASWLREASAKNEEVSVDAAIRRLEARRVLRCPSFLLGRRKFAVANVAGVSSGVRVVPSDPNFLVPAVDTRVRSTTSLRAECPLGPKSRHSPRRTGNSPAPGSDYPSRRMPVPSSKVELPGSDDRSSPVTRGSRAGERRIRSRGSRARLARGPASNRRLFRARCKGLGGDPGSGDFARRCGVFAEGWRCEERKWNSSDHKIASREGI